MDRFVLVMRDLFKLLPFFFIIIIFFLERNQNKQSVQANLRWQLLRLNPELGDY